MLRCCAAALDGGRPKRQLGFRLTPKGGAGGAGGTGMVWRGARAGRMTPASTASLVHLPEEPRWGLWAGESRIQMCPSAMPGPGRGHAGLEGASALIANAEPRRQTAAPVTYFPAHFIMQLRCGIFCGPRGKATVRTLLPSLAASPACPAGTPRGTPSRDDVYISSGCARLGGDCRCVRINMDLPVNRWIVTREGPAEGAGRRGSKKGPAGRSRNGTKASQQGRDCARKGFNN